MISSRPTEMPVYTMSGGGGVAFWASLREIWGARPLIAELVRRDLKVRYKNRVGGILWSLFAPISQVLTITLMVKFFLTPISNYSAYLMAVMFLWQFFQNAVLDSSNSILMNGALARKIYFPRAILPLVALLSNLLHFVISFALILAYFFLLRTYPAQWQPHFFLVFPILLGLAILALGFGYMMAYLNTLYDDVRFLSGTVFTLLFYALPILYPIERVAANATIYPFYMLNPIAVFIVGFQRALLPPPPVPISPGAKTFFPPVEIPYGFLGIAGLVSLALLAFGFYIFERSKWTMMERI